MIIRNRFKERLKAINILRAKLNLAFYIYDTGLIINTKRAALEMRAELLSQEEIKS